MVNQDIKKNIIVLVGALGLFCPLQVEATSALLKNYLRTSRIEMVATLKTRKISNPEVLNAMLQVPREDFVPKRIATRALVSHAYDDEIIPIEYNRSIPPPYVVAVMAQSAAGEENEKVLEVGTGSGYQTAVLSKIYDEVYTTELVTPLLHQAERAFKNLKLTNVHLKNADGYHGWKENGPYDAIVVNAALDQPSNTLLAQLKPNGVMILPIGLNEQTLTQIRKTSSGYLRKSLMPVRFAPLTRATPDLPPPPPPEL